MTATDSRVFTRTAPNDLRWFAPERRVTIMPKELPITVGDIVTVDTFPGQTWRVLSIVGGFAHLRKLRSFSPVDLRDVLTVRLARYVPTVAGKQVNA